MLRLVAKRCSSCLLLEAWRGFVVLMVAVQAQNAIAIYALQKTEFSSHRSLEISPDASSNRATWLVRLMVAS